MAMIIFENQLQTLIEELLKSQKVIVPVVTHEKSTVGKASFAEYQAGQKLAFSYPTTVLPPKEFLLPARDVLFEFGDGRAAAARQNKSVIFGLSFEDLEGIDLLTQVFDKPVLDRVYKSKREKTILVGIDRYSPPKGVFYDLYLQKIGPETYVAFAGSAEGKKIMSSKLFQNHSARVPKVQKQKDSLIWDKNLAVIVEKSKDHPIWDELAETCFGCGICSYVCPLCYCFETEDEVNLPAKEKLAGRRCRTWDSCMLLHFAEISNHNFRPALKDRIYNWYYHKFVRMPSEYGFPGCVDCNRCVMFCPAKINYRKVLLRLEADFKKKENIK